MDAEQLHHDLISSEANVQLLNDHIDALKDEVEYHKADAKKWALQAMRFDKWQPIETAPKSTSHILLFGDGPSIQQSAYVGYWEDGWLGMPGFSPVFPTHWMPLPAAPKIGGE